MSADTKPIIARLQTKHRQPLLRAVDFLDRAHDLALQEQRTVVPAPRHPTDQGLKPSPVLL